jgi:hypothetical protein
VTADGIDWDDAEQRAGVFADADEAWMEALGVLRHDDTAMTAPGEERPQ